MGQLDEQAAEATTGRFDQNPGAGLGRSEETQAECGPAIGEQGKCVRDRYACRDFDEFFGIDRDLFGVAAAAAGGADHLTAQHRRGHSAAQGAHRAGYPVAQDGRQFQRPSHWAGTRSDLRLDEGDARCGDLDQDLAGTGDRGGHLLEYQHLRRAELRKYYRTHAAPLCRRDRKSVV